MFNVYEILVFDMASLRFRPNAAHTALSVVAASGEMLATVDTLPDIADEHAAFAALDHALAAARVRRNSTLHRIGLYHPLTAQIVVGPSPSKIFAAPAPLEIAANGSMASVEETELVCSDAVCAALSPTEESTKRAWSASRATPAHTRSI